MLKVAINFEQQLWPSLINQIYLNTNNTRLAKSEKKIGVLLERSTRITKLTFIKAFKKIGADITPEQWVVLDNLYHQNGQTQTELCEKAYKNKPTISRIIDITCDKKYTARKSFDGDRRKSKIFLTAKGKKLVEKCSTEVKTLRKLSWKGLTKQDYETFCKITDKLFDNFSTYK